MNLLVHVSKQPNLKTLKPLYKDEDTKKKCICFSINEFVSYFGDYIYAFDFDELKKHYNIVRRVCINGMYNAVKIKGRKIIMEMAKLKEYRIYEEVDCKYCLNTIKHYKEKPNGHDLKEFEYAYFS